MRKLPPIEKIPEAYSAIAAGRIKMFKNTAEVCSSDYSKKYTVIWNDRVYSSNDNGTYWQGYAGYPILAVLMLQDILPLNKKIAECFKDVNWTALNKKHQKQYDKALDEILDRLNKKDVDTKKIIREINMVYEKLEVLDITTKRSKNKVIYMENVK